MIECKKFQIFILLWEENYNCAAVGSWGFRGFFPTPRKEVSGGGRRKSGVVLKVGFFFFPEKEEEVESGTKLFVEIYIGKISFSDCELGIGEKGNEINSVYRKSKKKPQ